MSRLSLWPPNFEAAIFDFDGTLAETGHLWQQVDIAFFSARGIPYTEEVHETLATLGFVGGAEWVRERYGLDDSTREIVDEWNRMGSELYATEVSLRAGAESYLKRLRAQGVRLALATTNDPKVLASMRPAVNVDKLFDAVVCGCQVSRGKDHPDIYVEAARRLRANPQACVVFEDILPGIRSARRAGMATVAVSCEGPQQDRELLEAEADLFIGGWEQLG